MGVAAFASAMASASYQPHPSLYFAATTQRLQSMSDTLLHFPIYIGDALKKFIELPSLEERGAWISIVVAMIHNDGELPTEAELYRYALIFSEEDKQSLSKALAKLKQKDFIKDVNGLINKQKTLRKARQAAGSKGGKKSKKNKQSLSNSESESESESKPESKLESFNKYIGDFENFWDVYGYKVGKDKAVIAYNKLIKLGVTHDEIISGVRSYQEFCHKTGRSGNYIKNPTTWLNGGHWQDEYPELITEPNQPKQLSKHERAKKALGLA